MVDGFWLCFGLPLLGATGAAALVGTYAPWGWLDWVAPAARIGDDARAAAPGMLSSLNPPLRAEYGDAAG